MQEQTRMITEAEYKEYKALKDKLDWANMLVEQHEKANERLFHRNFELEERVANLRRNLISALMVLVQISPEHKEWAEKKFSACMKG